MDILLVSPAYPDMLNKSKCIFTHEQALAFKNQGYNVKVVDMGSNSIQNNYCEEIYENIPVLRFYRHSPIMYFLLVLKYRSVLKNKLRNQTFDLILFSFIRWQYLFFFDIFRNKTDKIAITAHGSDAMSLWKGKFVYYLDKYLLKKFDFIFPVSDATGELVKTILPYKQYHKIQVVYNGISRDKLDSISLFKKDEIRKELNIDSSKLVLLTICNLYKRKGVDIALKADKIIKDNGIDFIHIIIGKGTEESTLKEFVNNSIIRDNVLFINYVANDFQLAKYYKASDIFVMPGRTFYNPPDMEGFGIVYAEAQYMGIPVIGGNSGGVSNVVKHGFTGFLVNPEQNYPEIETADYILKIIEDRKNKNVLSINAKAFISENFDWNINVSSIIKIINLRQIK